MRVMVCICLWRFSRWYCKLFSRFKVFQLLFRMFLFVFSNIILTLFLSSLVNAGFHSQTVLLLFSHFLSCLWYFLRLSLVHTRVLSEILSSRGSHTQYIDSQFWLANGHLWLFICLSVILKQIWWRVVHARTWERNAKMIVVSQNFLHLKMQRCLGNWNSISQSYSWEKYWVMLLLPRKRRKTMYKSGKTGSSCAGKQMMKHRKPRKLC